MDQVDLGEPGGAVPILSWVFGVPERIAGPLWPPEPDRSRRAVPRHAASGADALGPGAPTFGGARGTVTLRDDFDDPLTDDEHEAVIARFYALGPERLVDVAFDLDPAALTAWLADPDARGESPSPALPATRGGCPPSPARPRAPLPRNAREGLRRMSPSV